METHCISARAAGKKVEWDCTATWSTAKTPILEVGSACVRPTQTKGIVREREISFLNEGGSGISTKNTSMRSENTMKLIYLLPQNQALAMNARKMQQKRVPHPFTIL